MKNLIRYLNPRYHYARIVSLYKRLKGFVNTLPQLYQLMVTIGGKRYERLVFLAPRLDEFLMTLKDPSFKEQKFLSLPQQYAEIEPRERIRNILSIAQDISVNSTRKETTEHICHEMLSQLSNVVRLSRFSDPKQTAQFQYRIKLAIERSLEPELAPQLSYSQEGEDLILKRLFPADYKGFFVDVGAHHPTRLSNTYLLYQQGWRGINIDPLSGALELFSKYRPEDISEELAISSSLPESGYEEYHSFDEGALNTLSNSQKETVEKRTGEKAKSFSVKVERLDTILERHKDKYEQIDLLNIDVEGRDLDVLQSFKIEKYLPKVIVIEARIADLKELQSNPIYGYLSTYNYRLISILYLSAVFVRSDIEKA